MSVYVLYIGLYHWLVFALVDMACITLVKSLRVYITNSYEMSYFNFSEWSNFVLLISKVPTVY